MSDDDKILLGELKGSFNEFLRAHAEDNKRRAERWTEIQNAIGGLREEIKPVVRDHKIVVGLVKWVGGPSAILTVAAKLWDSLKDRLAS